MRPSTALTVRVPIVAATCLAGLALTSAQGPASRTPRFTTPPGFIVERVAGPPLVGRPIAADFDEAGRLYVAESSGSNDKVEQQLAQKPHRILRLTDTDGDGRFDERTVFAERMMLPQGVMWLEGSLYVGAPPSIWRLTDTNGDGVADEREEWFQGKTLTGCANDLHGPYLGPDGAIYWTKGAFAEQRYERPGRAPLVTRAAHIFRRRAGSTLVEPIIAGGMDNPVDVAFTATGEPIFTATFLEHPQAGRRDALIHGVYGSLFGKPHNVIDGHVSTGDLMPALCHFGPAAPAGLTSYMSDAFGPGYRGNFFAALFNMQKVTRHVLSPGGATFASKDSDFLVADSLDFHPTDVVEDADGSLLVVDTGGWYKLCCPTSQLAKPDMMGAIYRVRRKTAPRLADPRGASVPWSTLNTRQLIGLLGDRRPAVQRRAIEQLARGGAAALPALMEGRQPSATARLNLVWTLSRIDHADARSAVRSYLRDDSPTVRRAALHAVSLWRDRAAVPALIEALGSPEPDIRRLAAEGLGRAGDESAVAPLLSRSADPADRSEEHAVTYALVEIGAATPTRAGFSAASPRTRRTALLALDQIPGASAPPDAVMALLDASDAAMADTAWWVVRRHPEWGTQLAAYLRNRVDAASDDSARQAVGSRLSAFAGLPAVQELLGSLVTTGSRAVRLLALDVMARARQKQMPAAWSAPVAQALSDKDGDVVKRAVAVVGAAPAADPAIDAALDRVARDRSAPIGVRLDALGSLGVRAPRLDDEQFGLLISSLAPAQPVTLRMSAAMIVERATFTAPQLAALVPVVSDSGPLELARLLKPFEQSGDEALGLAFVDALAKSPGRSNLRDDLIRPRLAKYPPSVQAKGEALLSSLRADAAGDAARLDRLVSGMLGGDVRRGQSVFNSTRAACASCHAIGYRGGKIGPDLTSIGQIRSERDLLEAIVFPSASFVRGFEPVIITTSKGGTHSGVLKAELADEVVLTVGESQETRVPRTEIVEMKPGDVSLMPSGYGDQLSRQELADLLAFLKGTRWGANN